MKNQEAVRSNFYAIIPANVRYNKELEPNAKLLYGEVTALCNEKGYCWANNGYFAQLYGVDERTIRRWLQALKEKNFIDIELEKQGMETTRKIWLPRKIMEGQKCPPRTDKNVRTIGQNCPPRQDKNVLHNNTLLNNTKKQQQQSHLECKEEPVSAAVSFYKCLEEIDIPKEEKAWISQQHDEQTVSRAVAYSKHMQLQKKIKTTLVQTIKWACVRKPEFPKNKVELAEENRKHAEKLHSMAKIPNGTYFEVLSKCIEIGHGAT